MVFSIQNTLVKVNILFEDFFKSSPLARLSNMLDSPRFLIQLNFPLHSKFE